MTLTRADLRPLRIFEGLPDPVLDWLSETGDGVDLAAGSRMFEHGQPADALWVVVEGVIQRFEEIGGQWLLVATTRSGEVTGMLPFSRMVNYPGHAIAAEPSVVLRVESTHFSELLNQSPELGRRLVAKMSDRVRGDVRLEQQNEKMMALGRLSAGLAHELNNPAAAIRRASANLSEHRLTLPERVLALVRRQLPEACLLKLQRLRRGAATEEPARLSTIERGDLEEELSDWLEDRGVAEPWDMAATFAEVAVTVGDLEDLAVDIPDGALEDVMAWLSAGIESDRIVAEINQAAGRISELVASIKTYSHMDRSPAHKPTDVRTGLDNTVVMIGHKIKKKGISVVCEYQEDLPLVPGNAGELNQVWTNLIDNAVDAMEEGGTLILKAKQNDIWIEVEIVDDGPGIPEDIRARIFEPFFTTKDVGVGTGLGLGIALRIVRTHQGDIEVRSRPGETVMCVRLPVSQASPIAS